MRPFCTHNFAEFPQKILQKIIYAERCQVLTFLLRQAAKPSGQVENIYGDSTINAYLIFHLLLNPVSCGADGLLGDAHDAADILVFQAHLVTSPPTYTRAF